VKHPEHYRTELLSAIQGIDLDGVSAAIEVFREARAHGRSIFVCGTGGNGIAAARRLSEMVRQSSLNRSMRFHIVALSDELSKARGSADEQDPELVFLDQIRNTAQHGDVLIGISPSGNSRALLRAFEHANRIGCRTISIAGKDGGKLAKISNIVVLVPASHAGSVEDAHMIICHMIGDYFVNFDQG
jgi:D-sedoheptulose 7-phosphate isomerase